MFKFSYDEFKWNDISFIFFKSKNEWKNNFSLCFKSFSPYKLEKFALFEQFDLKKILLFIGRVLSFPTFFSKLLFFISSSLLFVILLKTDFELEEFEIVLVISSFFEKLLWFSSTVSIWFLVSKTRLFSFILFSFWISFIFII